MKNILNKSQVSIIASILVLIMAFALVFSLLTIVFAAEGRLPSGATVDKPAHTWSFVYVRPNPVGVGQTVLMNGWVSPPPHRYMDFLIPEEDLPAGKSLSSGVPRQYGVIITDPNNVETDYYPIESDGPGTFWLTYTVDQVGTWTFEMYFNGDEWFQAVTSDPFEVVVQQDPVQIGAPAVDLPTDYWEHPINFENREWTQISGGWYQDYYGPSRASFNPYSTAPNTAHIRWKLEGYDGIGGLVGGPYGTGPGYDRSGITISIIMAGRAYSDTGGAITCYDIHTGEQLWQLPGYGIDWARVDGYPMLIDFGSTTYLINGITGEIEEEIEDSMSIVQQGFQDPYAYSVQTFGSGPSMTANMIKWDIRDEDDDGNDYTDFASRIVWNVTVSRGNTGHPARYPAFSYPDADPFYRTMFDDGGDLLAMISYAIYGESWGMNTTTGEILYRFNMTQTEKVWMTSGVGPGCYQGSVIFPYHVRGLASMDIATGILDWTTEETDYPWGTFWAYAHCAGYGNIYKHGYNGVYCFDASDGSIVWHTRAEDEYNELPYGNLPYYGWGALADGKYYATTGEHSPTRPLLRGQRLTCFDAYDGTVKWELMHSGDVDCIAEGTLFTTDSYYDEACLAIGKGPTETTVSVSDKVVAKGSTMLIEGTVMDMSPAQPNTPAIADSSMSAWMEYLHKQQPAPYDAKGVPVMLMAVNTDGTITDLGTVTSDMNGHFGRLWTPTEEGAYSIIATMTGTESYYASYAETMVGVGPAAEPAGPIEPEPTPEPEAPLISTEVAIIAAVAVVAVIGIAAYWILKKRK